ncbi:unnamed protein product [Schistosoma turkestanicum]|nr:unnamed protein product [Schistosoma turkestanicum]
MNDKLSILYKEAAYLVCLVKGQVCRLKTGLYTHNFTSDLRKIYALASKTLSSYEILLQTVKKANLQPTIKIKHLSSKKQSNKNSNDNDDVNSCSHCHLLVLIHDLLKGKKTSHIFLLSQIHELTKDAVAAKKLRHAYKLLNDKPVKSSTENRKETKVPGLLPCYARVNFLKTTLIDVIAKLETCEFEHVTYNRSEISFRKFRKKVRKLNHGQFMLDYHLPHMLLVFPSGTALHDLELYKSKCLLIQDKASCFSPEILQPDPNSDVLDACAAPGNKTLQLISMLSNKSTVFAFDRDPNRFRQLTENLIANGVERLAIMDSWSNSNSTKQNHKRRKSIQCSQPFVEAYCADFLSVDPYDPKFSNVQSILIDPSCSGSGLSIRQPDGESVEKFTLNKNGDSHPDQYYYNYNEEYAARLKRLSNFQVMLLKHALKFPNVQRVVYSTCSIHPEENEAVVCEIANHIHEKFYLDTIWPNSTDHDDDDANAKRTTPVWKHRGLADANYQCESCIRSSEKQLTNGFFVALFVKSTPKNLLTTNNNDNNNTVPTVTTSTAHDNSSRKSDRTASIVVNCNNSESSNTEKQEIFTFKIRKKCRTS